MKRLTPLFILCLILLFGLISCTSEHEKISTNPSHLLSLSTDTISFDTVFTALGSSTQQFKVYNNNNNALIIQSIVLKNSKHSFFYLNVDGSKGRTFTDVEIRGKDSLFIFVAIAIDPTDQNNPFEVLDTIQFVTNGNTQQVILTAFGQNATVWRGKTIAQDTLLTADRPFLIYDSLVVKQGAKLTLSPGNKFYFHSKSSCKIQGQLMAEGTETQPIVFRGDRIDRLFPEVPYDRIPGQWEGIRFSKTSYHNELNFVDIHSATTGIVCDSADVTIPKLKLTNSIIHNTSFHGLQATACFIEVGNTQLTNAGGDCVHLSGGNSDFTHCTIANFFSWNIRQGSALSINNTNPIWQAKFKNTLVCGSISDEVMISADKEGSPNAWSFTNCWLQTPEAKDDRIQETFFGKHTNFIRTGGADFQTDFRLDSLSKAIDKGAVIDALSYPLDRLGRSRLQDKGPDIGCYEWVPGDHN